MEARWPPYSPLLPPPPPNPPRWPPIGQTGALDEVRASCPSRSELVSKVGGLGGGATAGCVQFVLPLLPPAAGPARWVGRPSPPLRGQSQGTTSSLQESHAKISFFVLVVARCFAFARLFLSAFLSHVVVECFLFGGTEDRTPVLLSKRFF